MDLFDTTGFSPQDKVFTVLNDIKYYGIVLETDSKRGKIKVDYSAKGETAVDWFSKEFWKKE